MPNTSAPSPQGPSAVRVYASTDNFVSVPTATSTVIPFDADSTDPMNQHGTSAANLTGTVQKTASANTLIGTSTIFTTELHVGDAIMVPGTANEFAVVTSITDDTHLTVNQTWANSASGQTARKANESLVCLDPGTYLAFAFGQFSASAGGTTRELWINKNGVTKADYPAAPVVSASNFTVVPVSIPIELALYDHLELWCWHDAGATLTMRGSTIARTSFGMVKVAPPGTGL